MFALSFSLYQRVSARGEMLDSVVLCGMVTAGCLLSSHGLAFWFRGFGSIGGSILC